MPAPVELAAAPDRVFAEELPHSAGDPPVLDEQLCQHWAVLNDKAAAALSDFSLGRRPLGNQRFHLRRVEELSCLETAVIGVPG